MRLIRKALFLRTSTTLIIISDEYRSVLSYELATDDALYGFIDGGDYEVTHYRNNNPKHSPNYFEIKPLHLSSVPASGVAEFSPVATEICDRLVVVDGRDQGHHIFGEKWKQIMENVRCNRLKMIGKLN